MRNSKNRLRFAIAAVCLSLFVSGEVAADCVNTCGSINDGRCTNLGDPLGPPFGCMAETDPEKANCNMYDSLFTCRE